jgi:5'-deoxynucleotidase YfbR-like HD superfamily hydrolase
MIYIPELTGIVISPMQTLSPEDFTYDHILSEIKKIQYTYGLNKVIRYNFEREEPYQTQSVAEHVCNMLFLAHYFKPLEDPQNKLGFPKVIRMIMMHDMGEIETGDIVMIAKIEDHEQKERQAIVQVKAKSPDFVTHEIDNLFEDFEHPTTREAGYAKAIDKLEGQLFWMEPEGIQMVLTSVKSVGMEINVVHKASLKKIFAYLDEKNFSYIKKFLEVIEEEKWKTGLLGSK